MEIFNNSTHFNPVDLVCGIKNYKGEKFNLLEYVDENNKLFRILEKYFLGKNRVSFIPNLTYNPQKGVRKR